MVPADAPNPSLGLSTLSTGSQSFHAALDAKHDGPAALARLRAHAHDEGLLVIAQWLKLAEQELLATSRRFSDAPLEVQPAAPRRRRSRRRPATGREQAERFAIACD